MDLSGGGWADLLSAIDGAGSVSAVALDLSACTGVTEFDPQPGSGEAGEGKIVSLILPDAATSIKADTDGNNSAFKHFSALKSVAGGAVTTVGDFAFSFCENLETVNLPAAVSIGIGAFSFCYTLETVSLPVVATIGGGAFAFCSLTMVNIPSVTTIDGSAFQGCTALKAISLPASLTSIGANPFIGCTNLTAITVAVANTKYKAENGKLLTKDGKTLIGWPTATGTVNLSSITTVSGGAFYDCTGLTSVTLPATTSIGYWAFESCTSLTSVTLLAATSIGDWAFNSCTGLTSVTLPAATSIGEYAFRATGTGNLIITLGPTVPELGMYMFGAIATKSVTVKVPNNTAWSGKTGNFTGNNAAGSWGGGWANNAMESGTINENISLTIEEETP
jgi:hypothetical protein